MSVIKRIMDFFETCRRMAENPAKVNERGGITEYPANIELRQW